MNVGWLMDRSGYTGGAELTQAEFCNAAPDGVSVLECPPGDVRGDCDVYVIHNCVQYTVDDLAPIKGRPTVKYWHDVGPWVKPDVKQWLAQHATPICCSPIQADYMGFDAKLIPPPVNLDRFAEAASRVNGDRAGAVSVAAWRNHDKAPHRVAEWAVQNDVPIDFFGGGELAPLGSQEVGYDAMPDLLARYETFVYLPTVLEPFGRLVAEAWAAGCCVVTNRLVGARYWIEERPEAIETAAEDFWATVTA